jgi:hypothetical protein
MTHTLDVAMAFVDTSRVSAADLQGPARIDPWCADGSIDESEAIGWRNRDICRRLGLVFPDAQAADDDSDFDALLDGDPSQEATVRRLHRSRAMRARWRGGQLHVRLHDRVAEVHLSVVDLALEDREAFAADLAACLHQLATSSWQAQHAASLDRLARRVARSRWRRRLGPASLAILAALVRVLSSAIVAAALQRGTLMLQVDPTLPQTFVTDTLGPPARRLGLLPAFTLEGRVGAEAGRVQLPVGRSEFLRAGPGAPYTVLPTRRPQAPYVLRTDFESAGPILRLGASGLAWFAALAVLPPLLFYAITVRPILRADPAARSSRVADASRHLLRLLLAVGVFLAVVWVQRAI